MEGEPEEILDVGVVRPHVRPEGAEGLDMSLAKMEKANGILRNNEGSLWTFNRNDIDKLEECGSSVIKDGE